MVIAVPGSTAVPQSEFEAYEDNIINLLRSFVILPDQFNIGLILYGERAVPILWPQPYKNRTRVCMVTVVRWLNDAELFVSH